MDFERNGYEVGSTIVNSITEHGNKTCFETEALTVQCTEISCTAWKY